MRVGNRALAGGLPPRAVALFVVCVLMGCAHPAPWRSIPDSPVPYERAWGMVRETVSQRYGSLAVIDPETGYIQTDWRLEKVGLIIGAPVNRTRLLVWIVSRTPVRVYLKVERQVYSLPLGRWLRDEKSDDPVLLDVATEIQNKFKPF
jgi:hypothetical protein